MTDLRFDLPDFPADQEWMAYSNCLGVDADLMFPRRGEDTRPGKAVCAACAVRAECLDYALANNERSGIWGGTTELERRLIRKRRKQLAADKAVAS